MMAEASCSAPVVTFSAAPNAACPICHVELVGVLIARTGSEGCPELRMCLELRCNQLTAGSYCDAHARIRKARRNAHAPAAAQIVAAWRARFGDVCPGYERSPHRSSDLTAEHSTPISRGGVPDGVLCRECNSRKGDR